jgi:hypothetical protein
MLLISRLEEGAVEEQAPLFSQRGAATDPQAMFESDVAILDAEKAVHHGSWLALIETVLARVEEIGRLLYSGKVLICVSI